MKPITTQKANCKDCHRCVRSCPAKAIGIEKGEARLLDNKCLLCGKCVVECPQHAKQVVSDVGSVKAAVQDGRRVIMSIAPSFISSFPNYNWAELKERILALGFYGVEETAVGAGIVAQYYKSLLQTSEKPVISACCPVVVNLIRKYYPELVDNLADIMSPMLTHGKIMREKYGPDTFIAFAGPCIAKIQEARDVDSVVNGVITFQDLAAWLEGTEFVTAPPITLPEQSGILTPVPGARFFPITGGIIKSFMGADEITADIVAVDGIDECIEVFAGVIKGEFHPRFIEALACSGGCVGGPANPLKQSNAARKMRVMEFARQTGKSADFAANHNFRKQHRAVPVYLEVPTDEQIAEILRKTGKITASDEKNCGACGYNTCREKAIAVYQGIAETEMCVPYMRTKAESFANIIVDYSLNGIIVIDHNLIIQEFNPTAAQMFNTRIDMVKGSSLSRILDCTDFIHVINTGEKIIGKRVEYKQYGIVTEQKIIPVREHGLVIAIISDVTAEEKRAQELQRMKLETAEKATEIIRKQMHVAQEIAGLLGETTAETKSALLELIWLLKDKEEK
ncbi:MAG: hydrogenase assembly protein HupF [Negativicutes bacterium]|nr:hydrogenase assembly protein HupF [Negativicutes bacterium]